MRPEQLRFKTVEPGNNKLWQCCICLHVRTATILLGMWHMILHVLALCIMTAILNNPSLIVNEMQPPRTMPTQIHFSSSSSDLDPFFEFETENLKISNKLLEMGPTHKPDYEILQKQMMQYTDIQTSMLVTFCTMLMTLALVMGAVRGKPSLLMPFFCYQLFDFCLASLGALSYLATLPNVHRFVTESTNLPLKNVLLEMNPQCLSFILVFAFGLAMFVKAYFIRVVWTCYKFLVLKHTTRHSIHVIEAPYTSQNLLPDYEDALKYQIPLPPPSYDTAIEPIAPPSYSAAVAAGGSVATLPVNVTISSSSNASAAGPASPTAPTCTQSTSTQSIIMGGGQFQA